MKKQLKPMFAILLCLASSVAVGDTIVVRILESSDDAEELVTGPTAGDVRRTSSDLDIGNANGFEQWVGLRFQNMAIPAGSIINSATVRFAADTTDVGTLNIPIVGELSLNPAAFSDSAPLTSRALTQNIVTWNVAPWLNGAQDASTTTPDLAMIVQEIVDQPDWAFGAPIVLLFQNDSLDTSERVAASFDGDPLRTAELTIDFSPPPGVLAISGSPGDDTIGVQSIPAGVLVTVNGQAELFQDVNHIVVNGMAGFDHITVEFPSTNIYGGDGDDTIIAEGRGQYAIFGQGGDDSIMGGMGRDLIEGGSGNDIIDGRNGNDTIDGADPFVANPGINMLFGGPGSDTIMGGDDIDMISGDSGSDVVMGFAGDDQIAGGGGIDNIDGGAGNDVINGGPAADMIVGSFGNDDISGENGNDIILGSTGADILRGGAGSDMMFGGGGDDSIFGNDGLDLINGQSGNDLISGGSGLDDIQGGGGDDVIAGNAGADSINGGPGNDIISGGNQADVIRGGNGNDVLNGNNQNDIVQGDGGNDTLTGGQGLDELHGGSGVDTATDTGEAGETGIEN